MLQNSKLAILCLLGGLVGCGGQSFEPLPTLPPLTTYRSDFKNPNEGKPLQVTPCLYSNLPSPIVGQEGACKNPVTSYPFTHHIFGAEKFNTWRLSVNYEPAWELPLDGPPNQSKALDGAPFSFWSNSEFATLRIAPNPGGKIPYFGLNYIRGVQGDKVPYLTKGPDNFGKLTFFFDTFSYVPPRATGDNRTWAFILFFFRLPDGERVGVYRDLVKFAEQREGYDQYWNWPAVESIYFPGMRLIHKPGYDFQINRQASFDVTEIVKRDLPNNQNAEFLGWEVGIEKAPGESEITLTVGRFLFLR